MATWNQNINSGGFLGGIGQVNDNAPRASDINPTLGLIRENNDLQRSGANNWGLQAMQGLAGIADVYKQQQAQERLQEFQGKWGQAYANGDRTAMRQLMAEYPDQAEKITSGMSGISDDVKESIGNIASGYRLAVGTGKATDYIRQNADEFRRLGIDPQGAASMAEQDPKAAMELADHIGMSALGIDKYYDVRDKMEGRVIDREKLAETVRSNQAGEALTARRDEQSNARGWAGISIQQQNANLARERFDFDKEIRVAETKDKVLSKQLAAETDALKKEELQQKIDLNKQKLNEVQETKNMSMGYAKEAADLAREIANDSNLGSITGTISPRIGNFFDSSQDLVNKANRLQSLLTQDNLKLMSGVLTDRDIVFLGNIASGLNITDGGIKGSEAGVKARLNTIAEKLDSKVSSYVPPKQVTQGNTAKQGGNYSNLWGD
ncbi:phage DNA ejection protein [Providencia rettgeri]|uniref:phage DNA ejection protein n=1 Tax=Providencia rettgeri TaxID=587 RepID=UPI001EE6D284|nr:phage DNA ejection protein [Providencia rettgeri]MCG5275746.1 phage DNA ejection protein [Providencia rettgeri]MCG9506797.1 phage DNA ejection protein [Providencia rettgeri]